MTTREIPRDDWTHYFDAFSRRHEGWLATVEVLGAVGAQTEAHDLPLEGVSADKHGREIAIFLGPADNRVEHIVESPAHVRVEEEDGADRAVQIETAGGDTTLLSFRTSPPPETVDGTLPEKR
jgi:Family of unknown function (DUF5335)